jgi:DNA-binding CsgD family transcriptional regulator
MSEWDFESTEQAFAEAALDPSRWVKALDTVTAITESQGAVLVPISNAYLPTLPFTDRVAGSFETYIKDGWHLRDERLRGLRRMMQRGVVDDLDFIDSDAIAKNPYYQEFLAPHQLRWFAGVKVSCDTELWCLSIQRTIDQDPFSETEKDQLARLSDRLSTSAAISRAFGASSAAGALEAFEISGTAVVLINRHGKVYKANQSAQKLLVGDIEIKKGRLVAKDAEATNSLDRAVYDLMQRPVGGLTAPVSLPRKDRRPVLAYAARLSSMTSNALADCQAMVILVDLETKIQSHEVTLRTVFRLSEAEAKLASQLAAGEPLEAVADRLGIAKETSRSQLKSIFAKTGAHRQAELVAMFAGLLPSRK